MVIGYSSMRLTATCPRVTHLNLLLLEDSLNDAELMLEALRDVGTRGANSRPDEWTRGRRRCHLTSRVLD